MAQQREHWHSKLGVILAVAGSAVGLGNFLRFPAQATLNGGGTFMIPYFVALVFLGIPLIWAEWTIGRLGGRRGHGSAPGAFDTMSHDRDAKYLGTLGLLAPFIVICYYTYIESWTLAYAWFSFSGSLSALPDAAAYKAFLSGYQGLADNPYFSGIGTAYFFFLVTFALNFYFIGRGIEGGIEKLNRVAMPLLVVLGLILAARVLTLGTPDPAQPERCITNALGFVWNPDFSRLKDASIWLAAAGQIFFTLSLGLGIVISYASYLDKDDDIVLSGLTAAGANEFCEVILGASIVIPAAFVFLGSTGALDLARSGMFNMAFVAIPQIFVSLPFGAFFSGCWFLLLFLAGITSSVSIIQPLMSFLQDEFSFTRRKATWTLAGVMFLASQPAIFGLAHGVLDELDFWGATLIIVLFSTFEAIFFFWVMGVSEAWPDMHLGARLHIPRGFGYVLKYVTPMYLITLLGVWTWQYMEPVILMQGVAPENRPWIWATRLFILAVWIGFIVLVGIAWKRRAARESAAPEITP